MRGDAKAIESRKADHIAICLRKGVEPKGVSPGFEDVWLVHRAAPGMDLGEADTSADAFGKRLSAPILVEAMTGGTRAALRINANLAEAVEELGLGMVVGSQRAAIVDPSLEETYKVVRRAAPSAFIAANMGCQQLKGREGLEAAERAIQMIEADAIAIHLNPLQEALQLEGDADYSGALEAIREVADRVGVPVIVKETGCGICAEDAKAIEEAGADAIDVGGAGGTSFAKVEGYRAAALRDSARRRLCETFESWGIPTVVSLIEVREATKLPVIASGGVRSGLDVAKSIALGACLAGVARPLLRPATVGAESVRRELEALISELKVAMFLSGARDLGGLREAPVVIAGFVREWLEARGVDVGRYARRRRG